jgi:hypothetical protein
MNRRLMRASIIAAAMLFGVSALPARAQTAAQ